MTFDLHMLYPLHTVILDYSQVFGGVPCKAQLCNFSKWFFSPRFGVVPIWELWQFCYVRIGPPKTYICLVWSRGQPNPRRGGAFHHPLLHLTTRPLKGWYGPTSLLACPKTRGWYTTTPCRTSRTQ